MVWKCIKGHINMDENGCQQCCVEAPLIKPSPALQAARDIKAMCFIDQDQGRGDEVRTWATLDEDLAVERIQEALEAQHRKTWALAMETALSESLLLLEHEGLACTRNMEPWVAYMLRLNQTSARIRALPCPPIEATKDK